MRFAYLIEPPFNFRTENGEVTGCDVELAKYINDELGLGAFVPIETEFADLLPGVKSGTWDMTTGLFATNERKKTAAFSKPIWALPDGLLVKKQNPKNLTGYQSVSETPGTKLAVIRDQFQHRSAVEFGVPDECIKIYETYTAAANAVVAGDVDAYASVARAHTGFMDQNEELPLESVTVPFSEKEPAYGSFAFALENRELKSAVDSLLKEFLGSSHHREIMKNFGFSDEEIDLLI